MALKYEDLDPQTRRWMATEVQADLRSGSWYRSSRLSAAGLELWPSLLVESAERHDDAWLEAQLDAPGVMLAYEPRTTRRGTRMVRVPHPAAQTLAEGEFNRYYARGLCLAVLEDGGEYLQVVRGKPVARPRASSEALLGQRLWVADLLGDLRQCPVDAALKVPAGPNSGLTLRRPR